ncbi:phosphodiesterase alkaline phosphatase D [Cryptosporidium sp. chipmunk genotype I]|uniref:phosphodiesterase alkaline phosphatase D n=1 Tax=Cryptosporidium sp. chipmunk genotype I TaxID=1280935 RepID=UPI00351A37B1|nr:phosphodiesterase alkaline phosphatase D [Cryptosporidium sp. chipmunk genotype I]
MANIFWIFFTLYLSLGVFAEDSSSEKPLESLVFVSCVDGQKQDKSGNYVSQKYWKTIQSDKPNALFWMGDSVYTKCGSPVCVSKGYFVQNNNVFYKELLKTGLFVDGTWDDHDYGVNDAGKYVAFKDQSQQLFLDFISVPNDSPRRNRKGVYSSHTFGPPEKQVKVIILDTRYHRDNYYLHERYGISSFAHLDTPFTSIFAASLRFFASIFGYGHSYHGDMLGKEQWDWLEKELSNSKALANIIISSVQVTTQFPIVESWGHFPKSRERLLSLIKKKKPKGIFFLSGDVHWGQIFESDDSQKSLVEVTSSGMTHSVSNRILDGFVISVTLPIFTSWYLSDKSPNYFTKENYGKLDFEYLCTDSQEECSGIIVKATIKDLNGDVKLEKSFKFDNESNEKHIEALSRIPQMIVEKSTRQIFGRLCIIIVSVIWGIQIVIVFIYLILRTITSFIRLFSKKNKKAKSE